MKETIAWVKEQLFQGWKCIVVDYGRIDSTHEAVKEMAKAYNNESMYDALCVKLSSKPHEPMTYHHLQRHFIPNMSVTDVLLNLGFEATS